MPSASDERVREAEPDISVCVPVYKRHRPPNLRALAENIPAASDGLSVELVVVLNGITADAAEAPLSSTLVHHAVNRGVSKAWNAAAAAARAEVLIFSNDDVELGPGSLRALRDALSGMPTAGVVGPCGTTWDLTVPRHVAYVDTTSAGGELVKCDVVSGFLFATRREVLTRLDGFDEAYTPCGFEEVDFCTGVRLRLGLDCFIVPNVMYRHSFGVSAGRRWQRIHWDGTSERLDKIDQRNRDYFGAKWAAIAGRATER